MKLWEAVGVLQAFRFFEDRRRAAGESEETDLILCLRIARHEQATVRHTLRMLGVPDRDMDQDYPLVVLRDGIRCIHSDPAKFGLAAKESARWLAQRN